MGQHLATLNLSEPRGAGSRDGALILPRAFVVAERLAGAGEDRASEQLGQASIQTTLNIYTHVVDGSHRRAIEQLEGQL